jgi:ferredoxin-NADP reductase
MTPRVKQYRLQVEDGPLDFRPGQHTMIRVEGDDHPVLRPYSPVNLPGTDQLILAIKTYEGGICSTWMDERSVGDRVPITGFNGNLHLQDLDADVVFCSTGTGITPMMAMLKQYLAEGSGQAVFVHGERTQDDLMYRETLDQLCAEHAQLHVEYVLSHEDWNGPTGYVQEHARTFLDPVEAPDVYLCGVPEMVVDTQATLHEHGIDADRIFTEGWEQGAVDK